MRFALTKKAQAFSLGFLLMIISSHLVLNVAEGLLKP